MENLYDTSNLYRSEMHSDQRFLGESFAARVLSFTPDGTIATTELLRIAQWNS